MLYAVWAFALFVIAGCTGDSGGGISSQRGLLERRRVDARLSFSASWEPCLAASNAGGWCARQSETADVERLVQLSSMLATGKGPERQTEGRRNKSKGFSN